MCSGSVRPVKRKPIIMGKGWSKVGATTLSHLRILNQVGEGSQPLVIWQVSSKKREVSKASVGLIPAVCR